MLVVAEGRALSEKGDTCFLEYVFGILFRACVGIRDPKQHIPMAKKGVFYVLLIKHHYTDLVLLSFAALSSAACVVGGEMAYCSVDGARPERASLLCEWHGDALLSDKQLGPK